MHLLGTASPELSAARGAGLIGGLPAPGPPRPLLPLLLLLLRRRRRRQLRLLLLCRRCNV